MHRLKSLLVAALAFLVAGAVAAPAQAGPIVGFGDDVSFTGFIGVTVIDSTEAVIDVTLNNTSPFDARITGWGFDLPAGADVTAATLTVVSGTLDPSVWEAGLDVNAPGGLGTIDVAAITGANLGGGDPQAGIPNAGPANPGVFTLELTGTGLDLLSQSSILEAGFYVRFQRVGENGQGSDIIRAIGDEPPVVPEPSTLALAFTAIGLSGVFGMRRLRQRQGA